MLFGAFLPREPSTRAMMRPVLFRARVRNARSRYGKDVKVRPVLTTVVAWRGRFTIKGSSFKLVCLDRAARSFSQALRLDPSGNARSFERRLCRFRNFREALRLLASERIQPA